MISETPSICRERTAYGSSGCSSRQNQANPFHEDANPFCIFSRMPTHVLNLTGPSRTFIAVTLRGPIRIAQ
jgi:hypothetical protein